MCRVVSAFLLFSLVVCLCGCSSVASTEPVRDEPFLLIDPGHGGMDGGTQAQDGTLEKNINLAVGTDLRDMLVVCGFSVVMTRDTDVSIHDPEETAVRSKKVSDMRNRLALYEQAQAVISLHQNHFSVQKYRGAQVFYSPNHPDSARLASCVRQAILEQVQPENTRENKVATDGIYLLYHTTCPAILLECGILSNPTERELLKTAAYRQQLAFAVAGGYWNYLIQE